MQPSRYPLLQQQRPGQAQKTAVDEVCWEQRELAATNEILEKKMRGQI